MPTTSRGDNGYGSSEAMYAITTIGITLYNQGSDTSVKRTTPLVVNILKNIN